MFQQDIHFLVRQQEYKELLHQDENERLVRAAKLQHTKERTIHRSPVRWLGTQMIQWGCILQQRITIAPACPQCQG